MYGPEPSEAYQQYLEEYPRHTMQGAPLLSSIEWDISYPLVSETRDFNADNVGSYNVTDDPPTLPPTEELYIDLPEMLYQHQEHWGPIRVVGSEGNITVMDLLDAIDKYFQVPLEVWLLSQSQRRTIEAVHARRIERIQNLVEACDLSNIRRVDVLHPYRFFDGLGHSETDPSGRRLCLRLKTDPLAPDEAPIPE
ncbi:hypothetical protein FB451DRAFT_1248983 [Mycena latifolia]|nr:hypothetical protein FB451DRAFT_1248983 [Mycena latifolia]